MHGLLGALAAFNFCIFRMVGPAISSLEVQSKMCLSLTFVLFFFFFFLQLSFWGI